eukprot:14480526-Ditylum_brightwellii.AAC.1
MERSKQNKNLVCDKDNDVDNGDDDSADGADKHLTYLTQVKNNGNRGVCDINITHVVKNTPTSLKSDVTGHVMHVRFFGKMPVSKNAILWLRGGGLKDDRDSTDN